MLNNLDKDKLESPSTADEDKNYRPPVSAGRSIEIRVKGHLNSKWSDWLDGLEVKLLDSGEMILSGPIVDQAALLGVRQNQLLKRSGDAHLLHAN